MSISTIRRKLKEGYPIYQARKVRDEDNLYRLYNLSIGAFCGYYTIDELEEFVADDDGK